MTPAELNARLTFLGLSQRQFSVLIGLDPDGRYVRRMGSGITPITPRVKAGLAALEEEARETVEAWADRREPVVIPRLKDAEGGRPSSWWHAIAGRLIEWDEGVGVAYPE